MNLTLTGYWNSVNTFKHAQALILKNLFLICEQNEYIKRARCSLYIGRPDLVNKGLEEVDLGMTKGMGM